MFLWLNAVDWLIIVLAVVVGFTGWTHGFVVGLLSFVGFVGGAIAGLLLVPAVLGGFEPGLGVSVLAVLLVLGVASIGQGILSWAGGWVRSKVSSRPARRFDAAGGATLGVAGLLVAAWACGLAISTAAVPYASPGVRESRILDVVDDAVPVSPDRVRRAFEDVVAAGGFPQVVAPWEAEPIVEVPPPDHLLARDDDVRQAAASVLKITGRAPSCDRVITGSGFVVAPQRVVTNAHVVAGVSEPVITFPDGEPLASRVVAFDPDTDLAVLAVPDLQRPALDVGEALGAGSEAVVVGYPNNGPLDSENVRVRETHQLRGRDIYDDDAVTRSVVSMRGNIQPGNSGGPLIGGDGTVRGVVFAASLTDPDTGYALAPEEFTELAQQAADATEPVPTGACT
ncbi:colicin V production protein [Haloactinopolyspora alba]|uniref:Colicin V production protein n=1 Tax=Haloactinopolyspora alba TaxID=648780 RepID=A0A2P8E7C7_9ACTN|nr:MarP family serine protease [Haloactinopolyspora alba]PSL05374.1 colicin V production protein [Haloactinopolyspora alba]